MVLEAAQRALFSPESAVQGFWGPWKSHALSCPSRQVITLQFSHKQPFSMGYKVMLVTMALGGPISAVASKSVAPRRSQS